MLAESDDAQLEIQAEQLAISSLAKLSEEARAAKLPAVKAGILKRLRSQAHQKNQYQQASLSAGAPPSADEMEACVSVGQVPSCDVDVEIERPIGLRRPPRELPAPQDGVEACGDDPWFADSEIRLALRDAVKVAHAELKIIVGNPAEEIARIMPKDGRMLGAGAVLRLGGQHLGGFGACDIAYAYRQLSRALHPDKNPGIADATEAFQRLGECQNELKHGLEESDKALNKLCVPLRGPGAVEHEERVRPQEALFAESARLIAAVLALACEGYVPDEARHRASKCLHVDAAVGGGAWARPFDGSSPQGLLDVWLREPDMLQLYASHAVRSAYDCAAKRYRAHFICSLTRLALLEGQLSEGCVRQVWGDVWRNFPEISQWQHLRALLEKKCRPHGRDPSENHLRDRSRSPRKGSDAERSQWAQRWRKMISAVLPGGASAAAPWSDPEVRKLCAAMWRDFADPLGKGSTADSGEGSTACRALGLFRTEARGAADITAQKGAAPAEWAFVPAADLLLIVGDGLVGTSIEGVFVKGASSTRMPFATAIFHALM